ncbi:hypothetical protein AYK25_10225 [Thermoplasmatales archaeon SM1-50]|nr:MAG: hypothetical protein AYK25_10225 [Thermoplasmatales archaeon SM1-50]
MEDFLPEENPSVTTMNRVMDRFPFSSQEQEYILIEGDVATVAVLEGIAETIEELDDDGFVLKSRDDTPMHRSILSVIQEAIATNISLVDRFDLSVEGIPNTDDSVELLYDYLYDSEAYGFETQQLLHREGDTYDASLIGVYIKLDVDGTDDDVSSVMSDLYDGLNQDIKAGFGDADAIVTGENSMMHVIMNSMTESQILSTGFCLVLAALVLIVAYRKPVLGLIAMIPVSVSMVWIIGTMHFIGYSLNVMTIMITSLTIGLGITYAIHAVERFRLVSEHTGNVVEAISETIGHTGGALLISAMTTIFGFGLLVVTPMPVEQQFGMITALTILFAFATSIFILPPVLLFWGRWRKKHKGYIISPGPPGKKKK